MRSSSFVHLHNHTEYSMLDGAARIKDIFSAASRMDMPAVAVTDHGNMFGAFEFWKSSQGTDLKPIIGIEAYVAPESRYTKSKVLWGDGGGDDVSGGGAYTHMTLWAENNTGLHNLFRLSSLASLEGQYFKPRMDRELLHQYSEGVIATSGCPSGEVQTRLRLGQYDRAREAMGVYRDIFGAENFFVEVMDHGLEIEKRVHEDLLKFAKDMKLSIIATNDLHYVHKHDAKYHDALLCVQSGSTVNNPKRFKFDGDEFYLKSAEEMRTIFADLPEACDNTLLVAERCNVSFDTRANYMPVFPVPEGNTESTWFMGEVVAGMMRRYGQNVPDEAKRRMQYEYDVIERMGFASYFLIVADYVNWAKKQGIRVGPGRGSGAGSIIAYALGITGLDPLEHGLLFERFLNPDRVSMPDFDIDFDELRRVEVIDYVTQKYGDDRVAQIVTYGTIKAKQALKDATRVLDYPYSLGEKLSKAVPEPIVGRTMELWGTSDPDHPRYSDGQELRDIVARDPDAEQIYDIALGLENLKRQWGVHAAGVIMSSDPLIDIIPIMKREQDGQIVTQFDYPGCEALGLMKMDFLGLRNLTVLTEALEQIRRNRGEDVILEELPLDDTATYQLLASGQSLGVFQLDSPPMRSLLKLMRPDRFGDISALIALYRPGPMGANSHKNYALRKNGEQDIVSIHPELDLEDVLGETYGLIVYQEQVMAIAQKVAGFTLAEADILRRAMGKKKKEELDKQFNSFSEGMVRNGYSEEAIAALWDILVPFSDYAFNKSHSAAYGMLSYWTAYLKSHYPAEYMAALLTSVGDDREKLAVYLNECRRMGINVLVPDVNESSRFFTAVDKDIRFGLQAIRNIGVEVVTDILEARKESDFYSFYGFLTSVPRRVLNKRAIASLIKAGAFDGFEVNRSELFSKHESWVGAASALSSDAEFGASRTKFGANWQGEPVEIPDYSPEWGRGAKLAFEREMLGLYVSDHPLAGLEVPLAKHASTSIAELIGSDVSDGETVTVAGLVTSVQHRIAKNSGNGYGMIQVEDFGGEITVMFMGKTYQEFGPTLQGDQVVVIRGRVSRRDDGMNLHAIWIESLDVDAAREDVILSIEESYATESNLASLGLLLKKYPGETRFELRIGTEFGPRGFAVSSGVHGSVEFYREIRGIFGPSCLS